MYLVRYLQLWAIFAVISVGTTHLLALPEGFELSVLVDGIPDARQIAESPNGVLYVGSRREGNVYAVSFSDVESGPQVNVVASGLKLPTGIAMLGNDLIIAALNEILRIRNVDSVYKQNPQLELITDSLPTRTHHGWKYLETDDDGFLYFNVGAPCNVCLEEDPRFSSILKMNSETGESTIYASGVRNSVGMSWHPETKQLWFSDNGRDWMGPEIPFEEINVVTKPGEHFGFPFVHAGSLLDPEFGQDVDIDDYTKPVAYIRAHSAALGIDFYTGDQFPPEYKNALFIAEHGSWNHAPGARRGYQVSVLIKTESGFEYRPFADRWLVHGTVEGRPNDVLMLQDGSLLISDDHTGSIYQVTYKGDATNP